MRQYGRAALAVGGIMLLCGFGDPSCFSPTNNQYQNQDNDQRAGGGTGGSGTDGDVSGLSCQKSATGSAAILTWSGPSAEVTATQGSVAESQGVLSSPAEVDPGVPGAGGGEWVFTVGGETCKVTLDT